MRTVADLIPADRATTTLVARPISRALAVLSLAAAAVPAQTPVHYVYVRGAVDTVAREQVTQAASSVWGVLMTSGQPRIEWEQLLLTAKPTALRMRVFTADAAPDAPPMQIAAFEVRGDSVYLDVQAGERSVTRALASQAGALPMVNTSVIHAAVLASGAAITGRSALAVFLTSGAQTIVGTVTKRADTVVFVLAGEEMRIRMGADGLPLDVSMPAQNMRVVRAGTVLPKLASIDYAAPATAPYSADNVTIPTTRGYTLAGTLTKPKGKARVPVVITISGSGLQDRDSRLPGVAGYALFRDIADTLGRRGIAVLRYDDRGTGESGGTASLARATSADFADDVRSVVAWLRTRPDIDGARMVLLGHSEGGIIAPMVATTDPQLRAIVLMAGQAYPGARISMQQNTALLDGQLGMTPAQRDSVLTSLPAALEAEGAKSPWLGFWLTHDPLAAARRIAQPVLILQGDTDTQVSPEQADSLAFTLRAAGNSRVTVKRFPATNHLFVPDSSGDFARYSSLTDTGIRKTVLGALADWIARVVQ